MTIYALLRFVIGKTVTVYLARLLRGCNQHGQSQARRFLSTTTVFQRCQYCKEVVVHKYDKLHEKCENVCPLADELLESGDPIATLTKTLIKLGVPAEA